MVDKKVEGERKGRLEEKGGRGDEVSQALIGELDRCAEDGAEEVKMINEVVTQATQFS